jgi:O-antigen ligase
MLVVGLLAMIISNSKHVKRLYLLMIPAFVALFLLSEMQVLEVIQNRLFETGAYSDTNRAASSLGSGRIGIYATSLSIFSDYNLLQSIFGVGKVIQQESIYSRIGMRIGSHNGFLDLLLAHGIVGLSLFVFFLYKAIDLIRKAESSPEKTMAVSLCAAYISMCMTQGFNWIFMTVLFLISLGVLHISNSDKEQRSKDGSHE